jgi:hypothetical protein
VREPRPAPTPAATGDAAEIFDVDQLIVTPTDMRRTARVRATVGAWLHDGGNLDAPGLKRAIATREQVLEGVENAAQAPSPGHLWPGTGRAMKEHHHDPTDGQRRHCRR